MREAEVAEVARWLWHGVDPGDWSREALEPPAAGRAQWVAVGEHEQRFAGERRHRALTVALPLDGERAGALPLDGERAGAFRRHAEVVEATIGRADSVGSHGPVGPWYERSPDWGAPFLRWRRPGAESLELRATVTGAELCLQPTEPYEEWRHAAFESGEPSHLPGGFVVDYPKAANEGLSTPGGWRAPRWAALPGLLAPFLRTLPAETYAIGRSVGVTAVGGNRPVLAIHSAERLTVEGWFKHFSPDEGLGWSQRIERTVRLWTLDAGGPGEVDGDGLARHLVDVFKAEKVSMAKLRKHVHGPESAHTVLLGLGF